MRCRSSWSTTDPDRRWRRSPGHGAAQRAVARARWGTEPRHQPVRRAVAGLRRCRGGHRGRRSRGAGHPLLRPRRGGGRAQGAESFPVRRPTRRRDRAMGPFDRRLRGRAFTPRPRPPSGPGRTRNTGGLRPERLFDRAPLGDPLGRPVRPHDAVRRGRRPDLAPRIGGSHSLRPRRRGHPPPPPDRRGVRRANGSATGRRPASWRSGTATPWRRCGHRGGPTA